MPGVRCPFCGSTDDLVGTDTADGKIVECRSCGHHWRRDLTPTCRLCGSTDLEAVPTATLEEAGRGEQRTPSGIRDVYRCYACGARDATSSSPVPDPNWTEQTSTGVQARHVSHDDDIRPARPPSEARQVDSAFGVFAPGRTVGGRWRLEGLVRWSSTGSLWLARAADTDRRVLFKLVHPGLTKDRRRTAVYGSAAQAVVDIRHPALLSIFDVKVTNGQVLIVAQALEGSALPPDARLQPAQLSDIGARIAGALVALHRNGAPHLDVRPTKILLVDDGARLVDLGSGRARAATRDRAAGGERLAFRAPEQILTHAYGPSADVYSLGLTLWSLAGGDPTRMGMNTSAQASYRLTHNVPPLDTGDELPQHLVDAIAAATRRRPDERPTAGRLAELLRAHVPEDED